MATGEGRCEEGGGRQLCVGVYHDPRQSRDIEALGFAGGQEPCLIFIFVSVCCRVPGT